MLSIDTKNFAGKIQVAGQPDRSATSLYMESQTIFARPNPDEQKWRQVMERDPDAGFVYAVSSTGIFCRPTCPSRRPALEHVAFFAGAAEAIAAGYRPCLRCKPVGEHPKAKLAADICGYLERHRNRTVPLAELASRFRRSPFTIQRGFESMVGVSPSRYQAQLRFIAAREDLVRGASVTDAIFRAGYASSSRFYERTAKSLGMEPSRLRKGAPGEQIHFSAARCALGVVQVASTGRGLCSVMLGDDRRELEKELRRDFPKADLIAGGSEAYLQDVLDRIAGSKPLRDLPVDVRATAFQAQVWEALRRIPRGETRSYSGVANSIDKPRAVRAVARACALNPISIIVPCHRVVGSDGSLTGYRWGIERKRKLLEMERSEA